MERCSLIFNSRSFFEEITADDVISVQAAEHSLAQAQRDIYDSHRHRIFSLSYHMTGNELEAEQLLADSFVHAFSVAPKPDGPCIDRAFVTQLRGYFPLSPCASAVIEEESARMSEKNIRRTDLEEAIQELPPVERLLFLLRDVEGYSAEAIAKLVDLPQPQVTRSLFSARVRLRGILARLEASRAAA
jgi:DNA-directed RNA polymerase specialized sigma24 family protein